MPTGATHQPELEQHRPAPHEAWWLEAPHWEPIAEGWQIGPVASFGQVHPLQSHPYSCSIMVQGYPLSIQLSHVYPWQLAVQAPDIGGDALGPSKNGSAP